MRTWHIIVVLAILLTGLFGCGGGGTGGTPSNPVVFTQTLTVDSTGGQILDAQRGIKLTVPPGALKSATAVTLEVLQDPRSGLVSGAFETNQNACNIDIDPAALADTGEIRLAIQLGRPMNVARDMVLLSNDQGSTFVVDSEFDAPSQSIVGILDKVHFEQFGRSLGRGSGNTVGAERVTAKETQEAEDGHWWILKDGNLSARGVELIPTSCAAVLVPGIVETYNDLKTLALYLARTDIAPGGTKAYSEIWVYEYNWKAHINKSGDRFANDLASVLPSGTVDVWGHSMGGLVARWAIEQDNMGGKIPRLLTLGTPHAGVPLPAWQWVATKLDLNYPGVWDLLCEKDSDPLPGSFIETLNAGDSQYKPTIEYYTLEGTNHDYNPKGNFNVGNFLHNYYYNDTTCDGIVPWWSAASSVLARKSAFWENEPSAVHLADLNHTRLRGDGSQAQQGTMHLAVAGWLRPCGGGAEYTWSSLLPAGYVVGDIVACTPDGIWQVGTASDSPYQLGHAIRWHGSATDYVDLHPFSQGASIAYDISDDGQTQVGTVWPQDVNVFHAYLWHSSPATGLDLNPSEAYPGQEVTSGCAAISADGAVQGGNHNVGNPRNSNIAGLFWQGTPTSITLLTRDIGGTPYSLPVLKCMSRNGVMAGGHVYSLQGNLAAIWTNAATGFIVHPPGYIASAVERMSADGTTSVGFASTVEGQPRAILWTGFSGGYSLLHPVAFDASQAEGISADGSMQVGWYRVTASDKPRAALWRGSAGSLIDLHAFLPPEFTESVALAVDNNGNVFGRAVRDNKYIPIKWTRN